MNSKTNTDNWIDRDEYPFQSHRLNLEMGTMHYLDEGEGEPVVMVHGNPTWSFLYRHLINQLTPACRCMAMDHIGFGLSDKPADWTYLPAAHARNLETLIKTLELQDITLIVQDWGGPIGLSYAVNYPENVKRLIILNTWMWPVDDDWYYRAFSRFMGGGVGRFLIRRFNFFARTIMRQAFGDKSQLTKPVHRHYLKPLENRDERKGCWMFPDQIIGSTEWLNELWVRRDLLTDKQVLIAWGMKDIAFREKELNRWIELFPDAQIHRLEGVGHYVQEEAPEELGSAVEEFLY